MEKGIKKAVATGLAFTALGAVMPASFPGSELLFVKEAKASSNLKGIKDLHVYKEGGTSSLTMYKKDNYSNSTKFKTSIDEYYVKLKKGYDGFNIDLDLEDGYKAVITNTTDNETVSEGEEIEIKKGKTKRIKVEILDSSNNKVSSFDVKVKRMASDRDKDDDDDDDDDKIYLKKLEVTNRDDDNIKISPEFTKKTNKYNVEVNKNTSYVVVTAKPEDDDDDDVKVKINDNTVDDDDDWEKKIYINEGKNEIEVRVKNNDDDLLRVYTLYVYRGVKAPASTDDDKNNSGTQQNTQILGQPNQWIGNGSLWKRTNSKGELIVNTWFYDNIYGQNYYFDNNGYMVTGWKQIDGKWYCFSSSGAKQTGWVYSSGKWYFMNSEGIMQTGWINVGGNFYYLSPDRVGEGAMQTGWNKIMGSWYYFDQNGHMISNTTIDGCRLGTNGAMV